VGKEEALDYKGGGLFFLFRGSAKRMFWKKKKKNQCFSKNLKIFEKKQGFRGKTLRFVDVLAENLVFFRKFSGFLKNIDFFFFFKTFVSPILGKKNQGREDKENWLSTIEYGRVTSSL
jgi:hypothetical protein